MRRKTISLAVFLTCLAFDSFAGKVPRFSAESVTVLVGEGVEINVIAAHSGLTTMPTPYDWEFVSTDGGVASVVGRLRSPETSGTVRISGIAEGWASISTIGSNAWTPVTIHVVCGEESPVRAAVPVVTARMGSEVSLRALAHAEPRTVFHWYTGRIGDISHPLEGGGAEQRFFARVAGTQFVWVAAMTSCSTSTAEFKVDVTPARVRAVRR